MSKKVTTDSTIEQFAQEFSGTHKTEAEIEGLMHDLRRRFYQSALDGEITNHLGSPPLLQDQYIPIQKPS